ncbi:MULTISPECIES: hypothetical protein [Actinoallomurus]|uniref:hypothetical protein n=1 Tax=Actinoallomurus TaxID=667113 RepID=UPI00209161FB|nr:MULTISPECIES: hypothetical protein [Actinoallomurus]MCO5970928.1 hypothetical protein [Actinoallomurus soli]MCO5992003.1 hypothetical protein [Actinoallomurus rhizosphaericola]
MRKTSLGPSKTEHHERRAEIDPTDFIPLLATDFGGIYQVYLAASDERLKMLRLAMSLLAAPFAAVVALTSAKVLDPAALTSWHRIPAYVFALTAIFGAMGVLPYLRLIEATSRHLRTARAVNNFRLLYVEELRDHFSQVGWAPNLPVDPAYPEAFAPTSSSGLTAIGLAIVDAAYISIGLLGLSGARPTMIVVTVWIAVTATLLFLIYHVRLGAARRRQGPANPYGFPSVES